MSPAWKCPGSQSGSLHSLQHEENAYLLLSLFSLVGGWVVVTGFKTKGTDTILISNDLTTTGHCPWPHQIPIQREEMLLMALGRRRRQASCQPITHQVSLLHNTSSSVVIPVARATAQTVCSHPGQCPWLPLTKFPRACVLEGGRTQVASGHEDFLQPGHSLNSA